MPLPPTAFPRQRRTRDHRSRNHRPTRMVGLAGALMLAISACGPLGLGSGDGAARPSAPSASTTQATEQTTDAVGPATEYECQQFFGDPDFAAPAANDILAMGASSLTQGASDPEFFAGTADTVTQAFAESESASVKNAAEDLAEWFRSEPAKGENANLDSLESAYRELAKQCAPASVGAAWESGELNEDGTKPATLVCSQITIQPQTFTHYRNPNVLTSNMFYIVGLYPRTVVPEDLETVKNTLAQLEEQARLVDDDAVREALIEVEQPFRDALDGDMNSPGLREPLTKFGQACDAAGFPGAVELSSGEGNEPGSDETEGGTLP